MAESFQTLREVGVALEGFRADVAGQFVNVKWILGALAASGVVLAGTLFVKIDRLEDAAARSTAILERIEAQLDKVAVDTGAIKESVQTASAAPSPEAFSGWIGVKTAPQSAEVALRDLGLATEAVWIYVPAKQ